MTATLIEVTNENIIQVMRKMASDPNCDAVNWADYATACRRYRELPNNKQPLLPK